MPSAGPSWRAQASAGIPDAATGAAEEILVHGESGLVVDPARPESVLAAVDRLLADPGGARRMGAAGARRWAALFTEARFAGRLREALGLPGR